MSSAKPSPRWWMALAAIVVAGAVLRYAAATAGLLGDELFTLTDVSHHSLHGVYADIKNYETNPPGLYFLTWLIHKVWKAPEAIRAIPFVSGVALIGVVGETGRRWFGTRAGLAAAALAAVSPFLVYYGSEGRAYGPATLAVACATYGALRAVESPEQRRWWVAFGGSALFGAYMHYTSIFPLAAIGAWVLALHPPARRPLLITSAVAAVLYAPWLPFMKPSPLLLKFLILGHRETADNVLFSFRSVVGYPYRGLTHLPGTAICLALVALLAVAAVWWLRDARGRRRFTARPLPEVLRSPAALLVLVALVTPVGIKLYATFGTDLFNARNLTVSAPALILLAAITLTRVPRGWSVAAPVLAVALLAYPAGRVAFGDLRRPPTDQAAALLDRDARPQDPVIDIPAFVQSPPLRRALTIYLHRPHRIFDVDRAGDRPWVEGLRTGRVFVARALPLDFPVEYLPKTDAACADPRFVLQRKLLSKRQFTLFEYVPRHGADLLKGQIRASRGLRDCPKG
jgi:hypothetical protein